MEGIAALNALLLAGSVFLVFIIAWAIPVRLWVEALSAGVSVGIGTLVGMRLRKVSPAAIVRPLINATKAGLALDIN
ncbi:MAG: flotillin-like FloA family protein, partial [Gemmatimonadota bacterium]|nr:flotillin-like FloA family protein [Gemmatimonadota bacterium]